MFHVKRLSESDTYKRIWQKAKEKAAAVLRALTFGSAVFFSCAQSDYSRCCNGSGSNWTD